MIWKLLVCMIIPAIVELKLMLHWIVALWCTRCFINFIVKVDSFSTKLYLILLFKITFKLSCRDLRRKWTCMYVEKNRCFLVSKLFNINRKPNLYNYMSYKWHVSAHTGCTTYVACNPWSQWHEAWCNLSFTNVGTRLVNLVHGGESMGHGCKVIACYCN